MEAVVIYDVIVVWYQSIHVMSKRNILICDHQSNTITNNAEATWHCQSQCMRPPGALPYQIIQARSYPEMIIWYFMVHERAEGSRDIS